jgi:hypothetical protein
MRPFCLTLCACAAFVAGCHSSDPVDNQANGNALAAPDNHAVPDAVGAAPSAETDANAAGPTAAVTIPAALHGRWGLTPADCTSTRGDAKGLLTISGHDLRFYESIAVPGTDIQSHPTSINGHFNFTGEGQSWSNFVSLKVTGNKLVRTETNPAASFTYAKC